MHAKNLNTAATQHDNYFLIIDISALHLDNELMNE